VRPHLDKFVPVLTANLDADFPNMCINASWALGEIAVKVGPEMRPFAAAMMDGMTAVFHQSENLDVSLLENISITVGRLALVVPDAVAPRLETVGPVCVTHE
jgi:hypothetical protein